MRSADAIPALAPTTTTQRTAASIAVGEEEISGVNGDETGNEAFWARVDDEYADWKEEL